jgi:hypothetical protein
MRTVGVPQPVRRDGFIDAGRFGRSFHHAVDDALTWFQPSSAPERW